MKRFILFFTLICFAFTSCEGFDINDLLGGNGNGTEEPTTYDITVEPLLLQFDADGGTKDVVVEANVDYELLCEADWASYQMVENGAVVTAKSHTAKESRKALLVVFNKDYEIYKSVTIEQKGYAPSQPSSASLDKSEIAWDELIVRGSTSGDANLLCSIQVTKGTDFCSTAIKQFKVGNEFILDFTKNMSSAPRTAEIKVEFGDGFAKSFAVTQLAKEVVVVDNSYHRQWVEQPEKVENRHYIYKTYYSTLMDGQRVRNFSVCYDTVKMCSRWVAYPGHSVYRKWGSYQVGENNNSGRTNAWAFDDAVTQYAPSTDYNCAYSIVSKYNSKTDAYDTAKEPIIPHRRQADICFTNGFGWGWARGHMLPSSQRYNTWENNAQTCYATNIMVQQYDFNSGSWADVEALERNKNCSDTLYVVVGTLFEDSKTVTRFGRTIGVPTHCYKLLLRTKSGSTRKRISDITSADELICIGFLFENNESSKDVNISTAATSVAEIEKRAGFKFFRNLNPDIADKVKSQNRPGDWGL